MGSTGLTLGSTFDRHANVVHRAAGRDVEALQIRVAELEVSGDFREADGADELPRRGVDQELTGGDVEVALFVSAETVGDALDTRDEHPTVRGCS